MHAITELPVYADEDLERLDSTALIALMVRDEDRVPRNVIAACTRLGEPMVEALGEAIDRGRAPEEEHPGEWWLRLHAAMILGLMPCESAGLVLGRLLRRIEREADDNMQDWLAGRWPALFANKPPASIEAACALAEGPRPGLVRALPGRGGRARRGATRGAAGSGADTGPYCGARR
jgi:hypothetical protein